MDSKEKVEIQGSKDLWEREGNQVFKAAKEGKVKRASKVTKVALELVDNQDPRDLLVYLELEGLTVPEDFREQKVRLDLLAT